MWVAACDVSDGGAVLHAEERAEPPLARAGHDLVDRLHGVEEPVRLLRAEGGMLRPRDPGDDQNGASLRQERTGAGVRGRRSVGPLLTYRRETPGVRRGRNIPSPAPMWTD